MPLTARSGAFSARSGCSSARSNRSGGGGARYDEMDLYFKEFGLADGSSLPGQSLASLSSEADEEERRQKAGAERQDREAKLLKMKAQRSQVAAKLDEWAANFRPVVCEPHTLAPPPCGCAVLSGRSRPNSASTSG